MRILIGSLIGPAFWDSRVTTLIICPHDDTLICRDRYQSVAIKPLETIHSLLMTSQGKEHLRNRVVDVIGIKDKD